MACYRVTAKTFMFCLGLVFWAVAGGLFYLGGYIFYSHGHMDDIASSKLVLVPATIILLVGFLVLIVGIVGCLAVCTESKCLLASFFTVLTAIFALLVGACALAIFYNSDGEQVVTTIEKVYGECFKNYTKTAEMKDEIDYIQLTFGCCGVNNATDWLNPKLNPSWAKTHVKEVPGSCCNTSNDTCPLKEALGDAGCVSSIVKLYKDVLKWIYTVAAGLAALFLIGMLASCAVMWTRREGTCVCCSSSTEENYETLNEEAAPTGGRGAGLRV